MTKVVYDDVEYTLEFREHHPPLWLYPWMCKKFFDKFFEIGDVDYSTFATMENDEYQGYTPSDTSEKLYEKCKNRDFSIWSEEMLRDFDYALSDLKEFIEREKDKENNTREDSSKFVRELIDKLTKIYPYSNYGYLLSKTLEDVIIKKLEKIMTNVEASQLLPKLGKPIRKTFLNNYYETTKLIADKIKPNNLGEIKKRYKLDKNVRKMIDNLEKKYFCLTSLSAGPRKAESFFQDIFDVASLKKKDEEGLSPKEIKNEVKLLRTLIYFKDECSSYVIPFVRYELDKRWKEIASLLGISFNDLEELTFDEIVNFLDNSYPSKNIIACKRKCTFFYFKSGKGFTVLDGEKAIGEIKKIKKITQNNIDANELLGKIGSQGFASGKVQLVMNTKDLAKFKEGNVLVTVYTAPEFVPAMKKAIAVVTDTGGVTSHAAIVSRELGKPAVVGTKIATQVLKDGDLIEVDANKGIVRIIERA